MIRINIELDDRQYAEALALTLARSINAMVSVDGEVEADFILCDSLPEGGGGGEGRIVVNRFEPVSVIVDELRARILAIDGEPVPNVRAVALTGTGASGVSRAAVLMARVLARLEGLRVMLLSLDALGGPSEQFLYEVLAKNRIDKVLLDSDEYGVRGGRELVPFAENPALNPLGRLSVTEMSALLSRLGRSGLFDIIVMDVPLCSAHWLLCMRAAEYGVCVGASDTAGIICSLYNEATGGTRSMLVFDALKPDEDSEFHGEAGARMRDFVRSFV
ncbi:MAG TPA: hypothetical protein PL035_03375 [Bacillota bacterium]|nr:hypothetical protein [Bacillota bacterium]HQC36101.1 hypothetical protein [Bacillota bacterium]